jgi:hypothetical protein
MDAPRTATLARKTNETDIKVSINLDDKFDQKINIDTGIGFLDHVSSKVNYLTFLTLTWHYRCYMHLPSMVVGPWTLVARAIFTLMTITVLKILVLHLVWLSSKHSVHPEVSSVLALLSVPWTR